MPMKVLHVIQSISPYYGGPSQAVLELCTALQELGVETSIATTNANGDSEIDAKLGLEVSREGVKVYRFPRQFLRKPIMSFPLFRWLRSNIKQYDMLHIHGVFSIPASAAALQARLSRIPYAVRPCGTLSGPSLRRKSPLKRIHLALLGRRNLNGAAVLHVTSEGEHQEVQRLKLATPVAVLPLGIQLLTNDKDPEGRSSRQQPGWTSDKKVILFLSRIDPIKGLDLLIAAIAKLLSRRRDFVLVIAGTGPKRDVAMLNRLIAKYEVVDHVVLTGFVHGDHKERLLRDSDIFVLPSYGESFGVAVLEAMASKLPVVITDRVNLHPEVEEAGAGVVTPCEADALAEALDTLLNDDLLRRQMGENGANLVSRLYRWDTVALQVKGLYDTVISGKFARESV